MADFPQPRNRRSKVKRVVEDSDEDTTPVQRENVIKNVGNEVQSVGGGGNAALKKAPVDQGAAKENGKAPKDRGKTAKALNEVPESDAVDELGHAVPKDGDTLTKPQGVFAHFATTAGISTAQQDVHQPGSILKRPRKAVTKRNDGGLAIKRIGEDLSNAEEPRESKPVRMSEESNTVHEVERQEEEHATDGSNQGEDAAVASTAGEIDRAQITSTAPTAGSHVSPPNGLSIASSDTPPTANHSDSDSHEYTDFERLETVYLYRRNLSEAQEKDIVKLEVKLEFRDDQVKSRDDEVARVRKQLALADKEIGIMDVQAARLKKEIAEMDEDRALAEELLALRTSAATSLTNEVERKSDQLAKAKEQISEKDKEIAALGRDIDDKDYLLRSHAATIAQLEFQLKLKDELMAQTNADLHEKIKQLERGKA